MDTLTQIPLQIQINDEARLANFLAGPNQILVDYLEHFFTNPNETCGYIWGASDSGKTHLLQALVHEAEKYHQRAIYLPLKTLVSLPCSVLENLEFYDIVAIDDLDAIMESPDWQEALFHFYNHMLQQQHKLLFSATMAPQYLALSLRDLQSRLSAATIFHLQRLNEEEQIALLILRTKYRGMELTPAVATYILQHWSRSFSQLLVALEKLDQASLVEQRKLSLPFVKKVLQF